MIGGGGGGGGEGEMTSALRGGDGGGGTMNGRGDGGGGTTNGRRTRWRRRRPQPPLCPHRHRRRPQPRPRRAECAPIENITPKNDTRWRANGGLGVWPRCRRRRRPRIHRLSKGRGRVEALVCPRLPSCSRMRTASACRCCCATRWSGGIRNYGSLKEGEGDKEFDGVTKNSMRVMRRV